MGIYKTASSNAKKVTRALHKYKHDQKDNNN